MREIFIYIPKVTSISSFLKYSMKCNNIQRTKNNQGAMNLFILGAGGYSRVYGEITADCGYEITFFDNNVPRAIGNLVSYQGKIKEYDCAFEAIRIPELREKWT